jgi:murein endopeptidase
VVIVLAPAVVLPVAALRGTGHGRVAAVEDPPSLIIPPRITGTLTLPPELRPFALADMHPMSAKQIADPQESSARTEAFPSVVWTDATSVGVPSNGDLINGTQLPIEGPNWVTWDPNTNTVPNEPTRLFGNDHVIRKLISVIDAYRAANPDAPRVVVGDISRKDGGGFFDQHLSHQNGLDVDVYYPRTDGMLAEPTSPGQIDHRLAQDLLDRFVAAGAQMIFVGFSSGMQGPSGVVIPYPNHENHMHVRFPPQG